MLKNIVRFLIVCLIITVVMLSSTSGKDQAPDLTDNDPQINPFPGQTSGGPPGSDSMGPPSSKSRTGKTPGGVTPNPFPGQPGTGPPGIGPGSPPFSKTGAGRIPGGTSPNPFPARPDQIGPGGPTKPGARPGLSPGSGSSQTRTSSDPPVFDVQTQTDGEQFISIDFNNVDINILIKFMSELTGKNFVVDHRVRGKVTIISPSRISVNEAYKVFESVLEVHGFATVKAGKVIKIIPSPDARAKNIETMLKDESQTPEDKVVTQLIGLEYADVSAIKRIIAPLISKSSVALAYTPTNTLILTDFYSNIKRLQKILKAIDVTGVGRQLTVIPLEYADATKFVKLLGSIFKQARRRPKKGIASTTDEIKFVADERTNTIILLASKDETKRIKNLIEMLDKQTPPGDEKIRVFYLEHATAEELAEVLQSLSGKHGWWAALQRPVASRLVTEAVSAAVIIIITYPGSQSPETAVWRHFPPAFQWVSSVKRFASAMFSFPVSAPSYRHLKRIGIFIFCQPLKCWSQTMKKPLSMWEEIFPTKPNPVLLAIMSLTTRMNIKISA